MSATKTVYLLKAGDLLGVYRVIRPLGAGGMGEVYLVEHQHLRKRYALKILPTDVSQDTTFIDRFRIEARVMADLEHTGIVRVSNFGEDAGRHYLVMDYVEGPDGAPRTLDDEVAWGKKMPEHVVLSLAIQLCDALSYAHTFPAGAIIHRDLKPGNILLYRAEEQKTGPLPVPAPAGPEPELRAKIADFGLAKIIGTDYIRAVIDRSTHLTVMPLRPTSQDAQATEINTAGGSTVSLLGTYDYMSPEQKTGQPVDARSDLYALGLILYRMLTGHKPEGTYDPPSKSGVSRRWDPIIGKCLKRDLESRYQTAAELKQDLLAMRKPALTRYAWMGAAALVVALVAALAVMIAQRPGRAAGAPEEPEPEAAAEPGAVVVPFTVDVKPAGALLNVLRGGAQVLEKRLAGKSATLDLKPGVYTFELELDGHRTLVQDVAVGVDQPRKWSVTMEAAYGFFHLLESDGQQVSILDATGKPVTHAPPEQQGSKRVFKLPIGTYDVVVTKPDHEAVSRQVKVAENLPNELQVELSPLPGSLLVKSDLAADLWEHNRLLGRTGEWIRKTPAGARALQLRRPGYRWADITVEVPPNREIEVAAPVLEPEAAQLTVQVDVRGRTVAPEHQPRRGLLRLGTNAVQAVDLPWTGQTRELGRDLEVVVEVEGYDPPKPEVLRLKDRDEKTLLFRLLPHFVTLTVECNVPADIYRLRDGQTAQGWRKMVFGRDVPIGKTGEPLTFDAFIPQKLTIMAEGYQPVTVDVHLTRPGATNEVLRVTLQP